MDRVLTPEAQSRKLVNLNTSLRGCAIIVEGGGDSPPLTILTIIIINLKRNNVPAHWTNKGVLR